VSKYQTICGIYESALQSVTGTPAAWTAFLSSACRNYKCRFDEQILIYAQRPDAVAVLEIEKWNKQFGRWVNKGATGIAVFDDEHDGGYRLKHYFDISDTHESRFARPVPIWQMNPRYEAEVIEHLENSFGELRDKSTLAAALISAAKNAAGDNITDYLHDLMDCRVDSHLEELDERGVETEYRSALESSVAYMLLSRCGINADDCLDAEDFRSVAAFNTRQTINALGLAASDIAEMCLREVAVTINSLGRQEKNQNRTFENAPVREDNKVKQSSSERSPNHGSIDISDGGRLQAAEPDRAKGSSRSPWQVRVAPKEAPQTAPTDTVRKPADIGQAERASDGNRADGERADGTDGLADGGGAGRDGAAQSPRPDEVGGA